MVDTEELRGETTVETIANIVHLYFGDSVPIPDDVIGALLVLAGKLDSITALPEETWAPAAGAWAETVSVSPSVS